MKNNEKVQKVMSIMCKAAVIACMILAAAIFIACAVIEFLESGVDGKTITTAIVSFGFTSIFIWGIVKVIKWNGNIY